MERIKSGILGILAVVAVASLFTVCKATGANSVSDISGGGKVSGEAAEITFDGNGGTLSGGEESISVTAAGNKVVYPAQQFSKDGYGLLGWYETAAEALTRLNTRPSAVRVAEGESVSDDKTLYAAWGKLPQVEFRDGGVVDSASYLYITADAVFNDDGVAISYGIPAFGTGSAAIPATPKFTGNDGKTFQRWATAYTDGDEVHIGGLIANPSLTVPAKVYAQWIDLSSDDAIKAALEALVDTISNDLSNKDSVANTYDDEFLVGNGLSSDTSVAAFLGELNTLLQEASVLLAGTQQSASVETDQGLETIYWTVYNYQAIAAKYQAINAKKQDPLYALAIQSGDISSPVINLAYTGTVQSVTIATTGNYEIDAYGASGGHVLSRNSKTATGGKGGRVTGTVNLAAGTVLKVRVGGEGYGTAIFDQNATPPSFSTKTDYTDEGGGVIYSSGHKGGYNGGGSGYASDNSGYAGGSGGGGASDIRVYNGTYSAGNNNYENGVDNSVDGNANEGLLRRIIVAAGGGGSAQCNDIGSGNWPGLPGGDADKNGVVGGVTSSNPTNSDGMYLYSTGSCWYGLQQAYNGYQPPRTGDNGNLLAPVSSGNSGQTSGTRLGIGGNGLRGSRAEGPGGGGGGYYGGEAIQNNGGGNVTSSGAGGSNFADSGTIKTVSSPVTGLNSVYGNGKVTIRYVGQ